MRQLQLCSTSYGHAQDTPVMLHPWFQGSSFTLADLPHTDNMQGDDNTFGGFPEQLRTTLSHALPNISVKEVVYPKYETRGDLTECVARFRDWYVKFRHLYKWFYNQAS
jgi:hypothetical protein